MNKHLTNNYTILLNSLQKNTIKDEELNELIKFHENLLNALFSKKINWTLIDKIDAIFTIAHYSFLAKSLLKQKETPLRNCCINDLAYIITNLKKEYKNA